MYPIFVRYCGVEGLGDPPDPMMYVSAPTSVRRSSLEQGAKRRVAVGLAQIAVGVAAIEGGLYAIAHFGPAFANVMHSLMWVVAAVFLIAAWRVTRHRHRGTDRRHGDRRD